MIIYINNWQQAYTSLLNVNINSTLVIVESLKVESNL